MLNFPIVTEVTREAYQHAVKENIDPLQSTQAMDALINKIATDLGHADTMMIDDVRAIRTRIKILLQRAIH